MNILALVKRLKQIFEKHGDIPVSACGPYEDPFDVGIVKVESESIYGRPDKPPKKRKVSRLYYNYKKGRE